MQSDKLFPTILLITDKTSYPIIFRHKLGDLYHIYPTDASGFSFPAVANVSADLIIIDDASFDTSIFNIITEFRKKRQFHSIPIIVISGSLKKSYLNHLIKAGANDFFQEPIEEEDLVHRLRDVNRYKEIQRKMDNLVGTVSTTTRHTADLKTHFLLDRKALEPIHESMQKGELITILLAETDHEIPDSINEILAEAIKNLLKSNELLIALGRGKFIIFLTLVPIKRTVLLAKKIQEISTTYALTMSIGIANQKKPPYQNISEMISDAKQALSRAKEVGNQILIFH